jgi:hypothetical protein
LLRPTRNMALAAGTAQRSGDSAALPEMSGAKTAPDISGNFTISDNEPPGHILRDLEDLIPDVNYESKRCTKPS